MQTAEELRARAAQFVAVTGCLLLMMINGAYAQIGPPPAQATGGAAAVLPLSGRTGQSGSVISTQSAIPGTTTSVNTINPSIQIQGPYAGSASSVAKQPFSGQLSFADAIQRGLAYNLGGSGAAQAARLSQGQVAAARSALLPNIDGNVSETVEKLNLAASGLRINVPIPGFAIPSVVGPFNFVDFRAALSQTVADLTALHNYRSVRELSRANEFISGDAKDLVVLAIGGTYLQVIAAKARVDSARAQLETANAQYQQALQQRSAGLLSQIDLNRSQVLALTQQQRLVSLQSDLAKQKINLARMTGLPPNNQYDISDDVIFGAAPPIDLDEALRQAFEQRQDLKAAAAQIRAAEQAQTAARDERLPSLSVNANYGEIGTNPAQLKGTYTAVATLHVPIWHGGRTQGDIEEAGAVLAQRQAELEDLKGQVESEVRNVFLDLQSAASQVEVARQNRDIVRQTLDLSRQRFEAGITDNVEVVQAQEAVAGAELDYINSMFAHSLAKLSLARAVGRAADNLSQFLKIQPRSAP